MKDAHKTILAEKFGNMTLGGDNEEESGRKTASDYIGVPE